MTGLAFKNNAKTTLSSGVNNSTTTIPVTEGSVFPVIDATDPATDVFFFVTLDDDTNNEIVKVTASTGSSGNQNLTVVRAQEGTTARAFSSGDKVELRLTAGMVDTFNLSGNDITLSSNKMGFGDSTPEVSLDLGSQTDSLHVPVGTTAQRPGSPEAGYLRYNSTTGKFEGYTNAWGDLADGSDFLVTNTYTTANASTTDFAISNAVQDEKQLLVFIDGVFQAHNSYSVSGTTVTLSTAPASGREVTIYSALSNLQGANMVIATMTGDNSDTTLDLGVTPVSENNVQVYIDGTYQNKDTYSISGQTLTFSTAPPTGTAVEAITHTVLDISAAASSVLIDEFTGNGSTTAFTLAAAPANENNTQVYVGGVYQEKATYSVSGTTLTLTEAPANGVSVEVMSIAVGQINSAIQLSDADGDTKVMVEESSDEDTIRMDIAGTEVLTLTNSAMTLKGTTPTITIGDGGAEDTKIVFDGNAQDYHIGLDDTYDDLVIGKGNSLGTTPAISINENEDVCINGFSYALAGGAANYGNLTINGTEGGILEFADDGVLSSFIAALDGSFQMLHQLAEPMLIGTNNAESIRVHSAGEVTMVKQPAFNVFANTTQSDISTSYTTVQMNDEIFDTNADFDTSTYTFTAPVTGKYLLQAHVAIRDLPSNAGWFLVSILTSNRAYNFSRTTVPYDADFGSTLFSLPVTAVADMDANDTAYVRVYQYAGSTTTDVYGHSSNPYTYFTGYLLG